MIHVFTNSENEVEKGLCEICCVAPWRNLINCDCFLELSIQLSRNRGGARKQFTPAFSQNFPQSFFETEKSHRLALTCTPEVCTCFGFSFEHFFVFFGEKMVFSHTNTGGRKNARNTFNIPLNTFEFGRKFQLSTFYFHFSPTKIELKKREGRCMKGRSSRKLIYVHSDTKICVKYFLLRLHYVIFTIFHRRVLLFRRLSFTQNYFFRFFFCYFHFRSSQKFVLQLRWVDGSRKKFFTLLLRYCVTADDFF